MNTAERKRARRTDGWRPTARAAFRAATVLAVVAVSLTVPGLAQPASAAACRTQVTGEDLAENAGPYRLIDLLGLRQAWDLSTGEDVLVGVVDSGVDAGHPDLAGDAVIRGSEFTVVPTERQARRTTPAPRQDCSGHGTAVAGLIAARRSAGDRMTGVAPAATIYPVRLDGAVEQLPPETIAAAIDDAVAAGVDVLNLSFGRPVDDRPVREAVANALANDVVVIAAAGNEGNGGPVGGLMYPAAYDGVLAVGAVTDDGQPMESSNTGEWIDLAAYGDNLTVAAPEGSGYRTVAGNSFAAAQVSGAAALVRSRFPGLPAQDVARRLTESASPVGGGRNDMTGAGIVDPFGALTHLGPSEADGPDAEAGAATRGGGIPVQAVPRDEPLVGTATATALAWSGALMLAVALSMLGAPAVRRAAGRRWRAGPGPEDTSAAPAAPRPADPSLRWLHGDDAPAPTTSPLTRNGN
ncbi:S8 family serine peptidase [Streptomyces litchfieldiae]|uniref:S8 family serine peptidase n=1 Tax=Streptomyces litchfieldiae TaxID=3075543 RepID=A0ABU2N199_9ACTN|nr:S8 family serine peptidase [Streptomyces sp. DSM 44938]MDT0347687.1 S8 family serine peptidase [Streptomyces sp. DSM 44938]